jgi:hypothetical protein
MRVDWMRQASCWTPERDQAAMREPSATTTWRAGQRDPQNSESTHQPQTGVYGNTRKSITGVGKAGKGFPEGEDADDGEIRGTEDDSGVCRRVQLAELNTAQINK